MPPSVSIEKSIVLQTRRPFGDLAEIDKINMITRYSRSRTPVRITGFMNVHGVLRSGMKEIVKVWFVEQ